MFFSKNDILDCVLLSMCCLFGVQLAAYAQDAGTASNPRSVRSAAIRDVGRESVMPERKAAKAAPDTVYIEKIVYVKDKEAGRNAFAERVRDKNFILALRTNILAVPLINVGAEVPFGKHFSIGLDFYYPWLQRNNLHKTCNELIAYGMDVRYWMGSSKAPAEARLIGHSFGVYGAGGHYDFERNWSGYQGTFFNFGVDWMYAFPLFKGRMHMELELGLGLIYSQAQPYDVFEEYGDGFRRPGERKIVRWLGPTRAQISLVVPIYIDQQKRRRK